MRVLLALLLAALLAPLALAQTKIEARDLQAHPFVTDFAPGSHLRMHLQSGDFHIVGSDNEKLAVHFEGKNADRAQHLTVRLRRLTNESDLRVFGGPKELQVTIEVPKATNLFVRMRGGDLAVEGVAGDKDVELIGGDLSIDAGDPATYAHVDASVRFGDIRAGLFNEPKGLVGASLRQDGSGNYSLHAHVFAGDLILK